MTELTDYGRGPFARDVGKYLAGLKKRIIGRIKGEEPLELIWPIEFWEKEEDAFLDVLFPRIRKAAEYNALLLLESWPIVEEEILLSKVLENALTTGIEQAGTIIGGRRKIVEDAFTRWFLEIGFTRAQFDELIDFAFSPANASRIAITETTRALYEGGLLLAEEARGAGFPLIGYWYTRADERVCVICEPVHGTPEVEPGIWDSEGILIPGPPAHPNCGCWIEYSLRER